MPIRKFLVSYDAKGKVSTREVPVDSKPQTQQPKKHKPVFQKPKKVQEPRPPKPHQPGQNRAALVAADCIAQGIKDPNIVWNMIVAAYKGEKGEGYLRGAHARTMKMINGDLKI